MKNITLSIDENILKTGREYARRHNISFNAMVRQLIEQAVDINILSQISFWDSLIIAAAEKANCEFVISEDLNAGQLYRGIGFTILAAIMGIFTSAGNKVINT